MLISIGLVAADGREYYAVNSDMDQFAVRRHPWLLENVWLHLPTVERDLDIVEKQIVAPAHRTELDMSAACVKPKRVIANEVRDFILAHTKTMGEVKDWRGDLIATLQSDVPPRLWAYFGAYDHVALAQLYGAMIHLPDGIPMFTHEIMQLLEDRRREGKEVELPPPFENQHNALADARWNMMVLKAAGVVV